jgi:hypothetical protein
MKTSKRREEIAHGFTEAFRLECKTVLWDNVTASHVTKAHCELDVTQHSNRRGNNPHDTANVHISDRQAFFTAEGNFYFSVTWVTVREGGLMIRPAYSQDSSVSIVTMERARRPGDRGSIPGRGGHFFVHHRVQTRSGGHPASQSTAATDRPPLSRAGG